MEAAVPCDDGRPRRTSEWNEPGPKAKEWGTERPWSGRESRAGAGTLCSIESSPHGVFPRFCASVALLSGHLQAVCFHSGQREQVTSVWRVCGRGRAGGLGSGGRSSPAFLPRVGEQQRNSRVWPGLFVWEGWSLRSLTACIDYQGRGVLRPPRRGVSVKAETLPAPGAGEEALSLEWTQGA